MEKKKIAELFMKGIDCSQVVVGAFAEELGITTGGSLQDVCSIWRRYGYW